MMFVNLLNQLNVVISSNYAIAKDLCKSFEQIDAIAGIDNTSCR